MNKIVVCSLSVKTPADRRLRFDYDVVNSDVILNRMTVENGRLVLPDGMSYALLVLPERGDMDLEVLRKLESLIQGGATVLGPRPERTGSLEDYPNRDGEIAELAGRIWGDCDGVAVKEHRYGKGRVVWNRPVAEVLALRVMGGSSVSPFGLGPYLLFDVGAIVAAVGMAVAFLIAAVRNSAALYREETERA